MAIDWTLGTHSEIDAQDDLLKCGDSSITYSNGAALATTAAAKTTAANLEMLATDDLLWLFHSQAK